ncbi:MAG: tRNA epoxyqueuosine(34) reductase QueG [Dehalococcoidia bacterium]
MDITAQVKALCAAEGFLVSRIARAANPPEVLAAAQAASAEGRVDGLAWMTPAWLERATDPTAFLPGAQSVILVALATTRSAATPVEGPTRGRVAAYAVGRDYHRVFEKKLRRLAARLRADFDAEARPTVDYGPLLERPLAAQAGMGWLGKSTMLLVPGIGPWTLLGAVATTLALEPDAPLKKSCGACVRCVDACPTGALLPDGQLDARLCISYHTIENRGSIPRELRPKFGDWLFGCDACLTSCPVGRGDHHPHRDFEPRTPDDAFPTAASILEIDAETFTERFRGRAIARAKREGLARNACIVLGNTGTEDDLPTLIHALTHDTALVRGHAAWATAALASRLKPGARASAREALASRIPIEEDPGAREEIAAALADMDRHAPFDKREIDGHRS